MTENKETALETTGDRAKEFWLFGYGSLIWKPPPHYDRRIPGFVTGYIRRFWQASEDHRGTPLAPGRVVTLITKEFWQSLEDPHPVRDDKVWGTAYRIKSEKVLEVKEYLDIREINGYSIDNTNFHPADGSADIGCTVYIGTPDNPQFVGPQDPQQLAEHIFNSVGPSGRNVEYLLGLEKALNQLSRESCDGHVSDLSDRVRNLLVKEGGKPNLGFGGEGLQGRGPHDEEEEVGASRYYMVIDKENRS